MSKLSNFEIGRLRSLEKTYHKMFAEWHVAMRKKMKLTRPEFAEMMFMSHHTVMNYEYEKRMPLDVEAYMKEVYELAEACKVKESKPKQTRIRHSCKVAMINPKTGERMRIFADTKAAAEHVGRSKPAIQKACTGLHKLAGGYKWEYVKD